MSLAEMKAQILELSPGEQAELERYLATLNLQRDEDWQERAFQELRAAQRNAGDLATVEDLRTLHRKLTEEGR